MGARRLARDPRPLSGHASATTRSRSPASIFPRYHQLDATREARRRRAGRGAGRALPHPALGRVGQDQLDRLDRALPRRPARRGEPEGVRHGARRLRPHGDRRAAAGGDLRLRAHDRRGRDDHRRGRRARAASWPRRSRPARRSWSAPSRPSRSRWTRCAARRHAGQAVRRDRRRGALVADRRGRGVKLKAGALGRRAAGAGRRRRGEHRGHPGGADGGPGGDRTASPTWRSPPRPRPRRWSCSARRPDPTRPPGRTTCPRRSTSTRCGRRSRRGSSSTCCRTTRRTSSRSSWPTTARSSTTRRSSAARRTKGIMGWVRLHPYNIAQKVQIVVEHFRQYVAPLLGGQAKAMVVMASRMEAVRWKLAIEQYIAAQGLRDRHARRVLGRGGRRRERARAVHRAERGAQPEAQGARHPRGVRDRRVPPPARGEQVPDRVRPAAALRHVRRPAAGGDPGGADALAPEPRAPGQGHHLRGGLRERRRGGAGGVPDVLRDRGADGHDRPAPHLRPAGQAGRGRALRRRRGGAGRRGWNSTRGRRRASSWRRSRRWRTGCCGGSRSAQADAKAAAEAGDDAARQAAEEAMRGAHAVQGATWARSCGSTRSCRRSSTTRTPTSRSARSSTVGCCRCWSSGASARGSTCRRWC